MRSENLESLSDEDLRAIAERMGIWLPPGLDRVFVVEEIVEALEEDGLEEGSGGDKPLYVEESKYWSRDGAAVAAEASSSLAARYNETSIKALVRDPSWAFALWDIAESDRSALEVDHEDSQLFLRVTETGAEETDRSLFFDIPVSSEDLQWYINLPHPDASYRIDLVARLGARIKVLARSAEIAVPRQRVGALDAGSPCVRLMELSGLVELDIEPADEENPRRILRSGA